MDDIFVFSKTTIGIYCSNSQNHCISIFRYVEEHVQRTGVAIETQGFSFITSGRKRESLTVSSNIIYIQVVK